jgi:lysozyme family protein
MRYSEKWPQYTKQWDEMVIKPSRAAEMEQKARIIFACRKEYLDIAASTQHMFWAHIGLLHLRESDCDFKTYLGNGDLLSRATIHVPKGRGPFSTFKEGALDALKIDGLLEISDWNVEKILYYCEVFNGGGYNRKGIPSPYLWGGTNIQVIGKYIKDGVFAKVWDTQPGCAPILAALMRLDTTIQIPREG